MATISLRMRDDLKQKARELAEREGVFCEPASAASLAGALRDIRSGRIGEHSTVVCTLTGHGLKDPDTAIQQSGTEVITVPNSTRCATASPRAWNRASADMLRQLILFAVVAIGALLLARAIQPTNDLARSLRWCLVVVGVAAGAMLIWIILAATIFAD